MAVDEFASEELQGHLIGPGPKRILSLDGGGVRGLLTLGLLEKVESLLAARAPPERRGLFRLCDYFDLIGGTSTGAIIAVQLARGASVAELKDLYFNLAPKVFGGQRALFPGLTSKFDPRVLGTQLDSQLGDLTLGSAGLRTGFALMAKRIDSASAWFLSNNPRSRYWAGDGTSFPNRDYLLKKIVQASASAPFFLDPLPISISPEQNGIFFDGGVTPHNNPCLQLLLAVTAVARPAGAPARGLYGFDWATGPDRIFMLSLGTGHLRPRVDPAKFMSWSAAGKALHAMRTMIYDASQLAVTVVQALSEPPPGRPSFAVNAEIGGLDDVLISGASLATFRRIDPPIDDRAVQRYFERPLGPRTVRRLAELDNADKANLERLFRIGQRAAIEEVAATDFPHAFDLPGWSPA